MSDFASIEGPGHDVRVANAEEPARLEDAVTEEANPRRDATEAAPTEDDPTEGDRIERLAGPRPDEVADAELARPASSVPPSVTGPQAATHRETASNPASLSSPFAQRPYDDEFTQATEALPVVEVPPHAPRMLHGGSAPATAPAPSQGGEPRLGEYALVARFPSSATADVFLGYKQSAFGVVRRAVVKWVDRRRSDFDKAHGSLLDEAKALTYIVHPNVVSVLDIWDDAQGTALALEYVAGTDLRRVIRTLNRRAERLPVGPAVFVVCEVLRALAHAHTARGPDGKLLNLVHRDVNPSNVLIAEDGFVKLSDFGTVLMTGRMQAQTGRGLVKGKVRYLAPEYIMDQVATQRVDLYSTGVMLFEMLTGRPCFSADTASQTMLRIVQEGLPYDDLRDAQVPPGLISIIEKCTHRDPEQRPATARGMINRLEDWMTAAGIYVSASQLAETLYATSLYS